MPNLVLATVTKSFAAEARRSVMQKVNRYNMELPSRSLNLTYHLDANRINARQKERYVNKLEKWHTDEVIFLEMALTAYEEAGQGNSQRNAKADEYTWVSTNDSIGGEKEFREKIERTLFPSEAKNKNQKNDVMILFTAHRAGATLITRDGRSRRQAGGMLGNAEALAEIGIRVLSDEKAVNEIEKLIKQRDNKAIQASKLTGVPLPKWVGKD